MRTYGIALLFVLGALLLFTFHLGDMSLWDNDEAKYTQIAREMATSGEILTLTYDGRPWFVHPPLAFWLQAFTGRLFGFNEFTARIWPALFGAIGVGVTYLFGRALFSERIGLWSAVILATMFQYFAQSRLVVFDTILVVFMLASLYSFYQGYARSPSPARSSEAGPSIPGENPLPSSPWTGDSATRRSYLWGFAWAGLATLTKGPVGLLLPAMTFLAFLGIRRELSKLRQIPVLLGLGLYLLIGGTWYVVEAIRHGYPFIARVIGYYTFYRFLGPVEGQSGPFYYYVPVLLLGAFPWTGFLYSMATYHARRLDQDSSLLLILWCAIVFIFYSIAGTKLPNYILPLYPLCAIGIASTWEAFLQNPQEHRRKMAVGALVNFLATFVVFTEVALFARWKYPVELVHLRESLLLLSTVLFLGLLLATVAFFAHRERWSLLLIPATMVVAMIVLVTAVLPQVEVMRPIRPLARQIQVEVLGGNPVVALMPEIPSLRYYLNHPVEWITDPGRFLESICRGERKVVIVRGGLDSELEKVLKGSEVIAREGPFVAFRIDVPMRSWCSSSP